MFKKMRKKVTKKKEWKKTELGADTLKKVMISTCVSLVLNTTL